MIRKKTKNKNFTNLEQNSIWVIQGETVYGSSLQILITGINLWHESVRRVVIFLELENKDEASKPGKKVGNIMEDN